LGPETQAVYRDDAPQSRLQRLLNASWPLFHAFGVEVRAHWLIAVVPCILFSAFVKADMPPPNAAMWAVAWTAGLYLTIWTHEMGHIGVGRRFGVPSRLVTLSPLGGLAHQESQMPSPRAEIVTALAGPLTQLVWVIGLGVPYLVFDVQQRVYLDDWATMYRAFLGLQIALVMFNLLPSYPLDGGRVLRGFLARRMHANRASLYTAYAGYAGALVMFMVGLGILFGFGGTGEMAKFGGITLIWIGFENFAQCRRLQMEIQHAASPYEPAAAWKSGRESGEAWKDSIAESERLSRAEELRERRAAEARRQEEDARRKIQERIDQLLDRINEVGGIENLPAAERRELAEASESLRRETAAR
jgi:Zn-dependent protease